jgi:hypothetical protein
MIKLTITTKNGTTVSLDIPDAENMTVTNSRVKQVSAVVYADASSKQEEVAIPLVSEPVPVSNREEVVESSQINEVLSRKNATGEKMEEGEVGGEEGGCKGEEGEAEGREEEKPEKIYDLDHTVETALDMFQFPCENGIYVPPMQLTRDFVLAFGEEHVTKEFLKARSWLIANSTNRKTQRGMGRFLNAWLCREAGMKRISVKEAATVKAAAKSGSLLDNGNETSQGW